MSKKYYRFFWGFMKRQENWLNEMADKGYRLIRTGKAWYEFEDCEAGKYRYAVEFVGEKSKQSAEDYASFLEDCGYRVLFKNLNLDYSVGKAVLRPWAEKGGKIATTSGSYNKELLLVEKENDGKPFLLHTSDDDVREYKKTVRKPWIFAAVTLLTVIVISLGSVFVTKALGIESARSATRIGYIGNAGYSSWNGRYGFLDGAMKKTVHPKTDVLHIEVTTDDGTISIEIRDADGNVIFDKYDIGTESFDVAVPEKVVVRIIADSHKGSFSIE